MKEVVLEVKEGPNRVWDNNNSIVVSFFQFPQIATQLFTVAMYALVNLNQHLQQPVFECIPLVAHIIVISVFRRTLALTQE